MGNDLVSQKPSISNRTSSSEDQFLESFLTNDASNHKSTTIYDNHFGDISLFSEGETDKYLIKQLKFQDSSSFEKALLKFSRKIEISHKNLIKLHKFKTSKNNLLCSNVYKLAFMLEYIKRDLTSEIRSKRLQNTIFSTENLVNFINSCVSAMSFLQKNDISLGNLRSFSIFIDSENNYKLFDGDLLNFPTNLSLFLMNRRENTEQEYNSSSISGVYLAPELLFHLKSRLNGKNCDIYKGDVFTFGMILLEMINLKSMDFLYEYPSFTLKENLLKEFIENNIKEKFPLEISQFVAFCLDFDQKKRPDFIELETIIKGLFQEKRGKFGINIRKSVDNKENPRFFKETAEKSPVDIMEYLYKELENGIFF